MTPLMSLAQLDTMAWTIDHDGIAAVPAADLEALGHAARVAGVHPAVADIVVDPSSPVAVRNRAFGRIAVRVGRFDPTLTTDPSFTRAA